MMEQFISWISAQPLLIKGLIGGGIISAFNMLGALIILVWRSPSRKSLDAGLGFSAGVMLSASYTSLIIPGIEAGGIYRVLVGIVLGYLLMDFGDHKLPHMHMFKGYEGFSPTANRNIKRTMLLIFGITLHNVPEGLSVGIGFGSNDIRNAIVLMLAIGIQNIPEGFAVSVAALASGKRKSFIAVFTGIRSGLVELPVAVVGAIAVGFSAPLLPYAMGFAAGAMLYIISDEIIPETHVEKGHERVATLGLILGVMLMLYLDVVTAP